MNVIINMNVQFEILTAVYMFVVILIVTPYGLLGGVPRFGGTYCLHLQVLRWMKGVPPKCWNLSTSPHVVRTGKPPRTNVEGCFITGCYAQYF
jgi:hypothetical protein